MTREAQRDGAQRNKAQQEKVGAERDHCEPGHQSLHSTAARLSNADLLRRVVVLANAEREATVELVAHLAELDTRRLYLGQGHGSLFSYCTGVLRLAEHAALNRIHAARATREFPAILDLLADGSLNLSTVRLIAPHLSADNFESVVTMAMGKSKREVETLVAGLAPQPDVASSIRKVPAPVHHAATDPAASIRKQPTANRAAPAPPIPTSIAQESFRNLLAAPDAAPAPLRPNQRPVVAPLAPGRYRVQFTVGEETHEKLRRAQDLLRREIPDGDPGAIFDRALTLLLEDVVRKKLALTSKPRPPVAGVTASRDVPASVKRAVWIRDGGRCAFVAANGRRCTERTFLEFHHRVPYAVGGEATVANISLRCRPHNSHEAERDFGPGVVSASRETCAAREAGAARADSPRGESSTSDADTRRSRQQDVAAPPERQSTSQSDPRRPRPTTAPTPS